MSGINRSTAIWTIVCGFSGIKEDVDPLLCTTSLSRHQVNYVVSKIREANSPQEGNSVKPLSGSSVSPTDIFYPTDLWISVVDFLKSLGEELNKWISYLNALNVRRISFVKETMESFDRLENTSRKIRGIRSTIVRLQSESASVFSKNKKKIDSFVFDVKGATLGHRNYVEANVQRNVKSLADLIAFFVEERRGRPHKILDEYCVPVQKISDAVVAFQNGTSDVSTFLREVEEVGRDVFLFNRVFYIFNAKTRGDSDAIECLFKCKTALLSLKSDRENMPYFLEQINMAAEFLSKFSDAVMLIEDLYLKTENRLFEVLNTKLLQLEEASKHSHSMSYLEGDFQRAMDSFFYEVEELIPLKEKEFDDIFLKISHLKQEEGLVNSWVRWNPTTYLLSRELNLLKKKSEKERDCFEAWNSAQQFRLDPMPEKEGATASEELFKEGVFRHRASVRSSAITGKEGRVIATEKSWKQEPVASIACSPEEGFFGELT